MHRDSISWRFPCIDAIVLVAPASRWLLAFSGTPTPPALHASGRARCQSYLGGRRVGSEIFPSRWPLVRRACSFKLDRYSVLPFASPIFTGKRGLAAYAGTI